MTFSSFFSRLALWSSQIVSRAQKWGCAAAAASATAIIDRFCCCCALDSLFCYSRHWLFIVNDLSLSLCLHNISFSPPVCVCVCATLMSGPVFYDAPIQNVEIHIKKRNRRRRNTLITIQRPSLSTHTHKKRVQLVGSFSFGNVVMESRKGRESKASASIDLSASSLQTKEKLAIEMEAERLVDSVLVLLCMTWPRINNIYQRLSNCIHVTWEDDE